MSTPAFVYVQDTVTYQTSDTPGFPGNIHVDSVTLTIDQPVKAGDFLFVTIGWSSDSTQVPTGIACGSPSACSGESNVWDQIGSHSNNKEQRRWGCLVRSPLDIGDTVVITFTYTSPGVGFYPSAYIASLIQFSDVLSIDDSRYANVAGHLAYTSQFTYAYGTPDNEFNVTVTPAGLLTDIIPAGRMAIVDIGTGQTTGMQIPDNVDMSAWTERVDSQVSNPAGFATGFGRSLAVYTRQFPTDLTVSASRYLGSIADGQSGTSQCTFAYLTLLQGYRLAFTITSRCAGEPLRCVQVELSNGEIAFTDDNGEVYFTVAADDYTYTVTYDDYGTVEGEITVADDEEVAIILEPDAGCPDDPDGEDEGTGEDHVCVDGRAACATMPLSGATCA